MQGVVWTGEDRKVFDRPGQEGTTQEMTEEHRAG